MKSVSIVATVLGVVLIIVGLSPSAAAGSTTPLSCPPNATITFNNGGVDVGTLLSPIGAAGTPGWSAAYGYSNPNSPVGVPATYTSSLSASQLSTDFESGVKSSSVDSSTPGWFASTYGGPAWFYIPDLYYQANGSCSNAAVSTSSSSTTTAISTTIGQQGRIKQGSPLWLLAVLGIILVGGGQYDNVKRRKPSR